jgi:hypothetical protein
MRGPAFILVTYFTPKIKLVTFLNEWGKILPLRLEGQFTTHVTAGVRIIYGQFTTHVTAGVRII